MAASLIATKESEAAPGASEALVALTPPPVAGLHLQFGADASSEMVVSWHTLESVRRPRVLLGQIDGKLEQTIEAQEVSYQDAKSGQTVYVYHAKLSRLAADTPYLYGALHEGAEPEAKLRFGMSSPASRWRDSTSKRKRSKPEERGRAGRKSRRGRLHLSRSWKC